jgi:hypothetical protein
MPAIVLGNTTLNTSWQLIFDGPGLANIYCPAAVQLAYSETPSAAETATWPAGIPLYLPEKRQGRKVYAKVASSTAVLQLVS